MTGVPFGSFSWLGCRVNCAVRLHATVSLGGAIYPLETPVICPKESCGIKRAIRRALYFVSSKTVGGAIRPLNSLPETGKTKEF